MPLIPSENRRLTPGFCLLWDASELQTRERLGGLFGRFYTTVRPHEPFKVTLQADNQSIEYWKFNDTSDRVGMTEMKHTTGLLDIFDELVRRYPWLMIDTCAAGGNRLRLDTLRRAIHSLARRSLRPTRCS